MPFNRSRRGETVVDAMTQYRIALQLVGWTYVYFVLMSLLVNVVDLLPLLTADRGSAGFETAAEVAEALSFSVTVPLALTLIFVSAHAIITTHRIVGPVYHAKAVLREMAGGTFREVVRFRNKDFLKDLAEELTKTCQSLRGERALSREKSIATVEAAQSVLNAAADGADRQELLALARDVVSQAQDLNVHLAGPTLAEQRAAAAEAGNEGARAVAQTEAPAQPLELAETVDIRG